jgi:hypothetical protein
MSRVRIGFERGSSTTFNHLTCSKHALTGISSVTADATRVSASTEQLHAEMLRRIEAIE